MSDKYIEKIFLYLLALSVLLHLAAFELISHLPADKAKEEQTTMVDLADLPKIPAPSPKPTLRRQPEPKPVERFAERRQRVAREMAPRALQPAIPVQPLPPQLRRSMPAQAAPQVAGPASTVQEATRVPGGKAESEQVRPSEGVPRPKGPPTIDRSRLFPSARTLARLEDNYRERYSREVEDGETKFLNTDDIQFGSFMRRLENAIYGVWRYPEAALARGAEGTTPVRITFNRAGEIVHVDLLDTSGSRILDDEVMRTLKQLGPIGSLPRGYKGEVFKLIAFFHYGIGGVGILR